MYKLRLKYISSNAVLLFNTVEFYWVIWRLDLILNLFREFL